MRWYSRSVSVIAGATVIESPVCTPIGSTFSIEQTTTTLSWLSRISSSSYSFQPRIDSSSSTSVVGRRVRARRRRSGRRSLGVVGHAGAEAAHGERRPDHDRVAELVDGVAAPRPWCGRRATAGRLAADARRRCSLNFWRSSPRWIASMSAPISSTPYSLQHAVLVQRDRGVQRGLPAQGRQQRVRALLGDDLLDELRGDRLDVGGVGELRVGHDRRRVGVDQDDPQALGAQHAAGLGAGVVELAGLADDDRPGADDQDAGDVGAPRHQRSPFESAIRSANRSNR